jgi:anti-anti-sigma regulatory factor
MPIKTFLAAVIDIDTSGIHALEDLYKSLQKREIQVYH